MPVISPFGFRSTLKGLPNEEQSRAAYHAAELLDYHTDEKIIRNEYELVLNLVPSPHGIDWSTPTTLSRSVVDNYLTFFNHFIGHVNVGLRINGKTLLCGQASENLDAKTQLFTKHIGIGILFHSFQGFFETTHSLEAEIGQRGLTGRGNFVIFKINREAAIQVQKYIEAYNKDEIYKNYGLSHRPLHGEGGGCSAFGASVLEVAGILDKEFTEYCGALIRVPNHLLGQPVSTNKVSFVKLLAGPTRWAKENEPHEPIFYWDPDKMYNWIFNKIHHPSKGIRSAKFLNMNGIIIDKSHCPPPKGDFRKFNNTDTWYNQNQSFYPKGFGWKNL